MGIVSWVEGRELGDGECEDTVWFLGEGGRLGRRERERDLLKGMEVVERMCLSDREAVTDRNGEREKHCETGRRQRKNNRRERDGGEDR
jgi:hypothetical protein